MKIDNTLREISKAWISAEREVADYVREFHPGLGEEYITEKIFGALQGALTRANDENLIPVAFAKDLEEAFPDMWNRHEDIAGGLIAEVLHNRRREGRTGADFGLLVSRPDIERSAGRIDISWVRNGLLCQAKLKRPRKKTWGKLTAPQNKVLPERLRFSAFTLYEYVDKKSRNLRLGRWFPCKGASLNRIQRFLKGEAFPRLKTSAPLLRALASGRLGTQDSETIKNVIAPSGSRAFELRIRWKDRGTDPFSVPVTRDNAVKVENYRVS